MDDATSTAVPTEGVSPEQRHSNASTVAAGGDGDWPSKQPARIADTSAKPVHWRETWWLHIASIIFSTIYIIIAGVMALPRYGFTSIGLFSWIGLIAPLLALVFVSGPELIARRLRSNRRGWIPAVHIGLSLIIWLAAIATGGINSYLWGVFNDTNFGDWEEGCPDAESRWGFKCYGIPLIGHFMVVAIILFLLGGIHLYLFVVAIMQHKERMRLKAQNSNA